MKPRDWGLAIIEAALWYYFIYYALYSIKMDVDLYQSALILVFIMYAASFACPYMRHTDAWKKLWRE